MLNPPTPRRLGHTDSVGTSSTRRRSSAEVACPVGGLAESGVLRCSGSDQGASGSG
jgi:hypothetical protein